MVDTAVLIEGLVKRGLIRVMQKRLCTVIIAGLIVLSLSWSAFAQGAAAPAGPAVPWFSGEAVPMTDDELAAVSGDASSIVVSAIVGAAGSSLAYAVSPGEKSLTGLAMAAAAGALAGTVSGTIRSAKLIAETGKAVVTATDVVIDAVAGMAEQVLASALSHLYTKK